nr:reverse transcriptase domain-containing protein [Tanacetum cinerariifolium]
MIGGNGGNQFRQYAGQNAGNLNGYNVVQNVRNQVAQNPRVQNVRNQNGLMDVQGNGLDDGVAASFQMPPKRASTSEALAITQAAIRKLVADSVTVALEAQDATMANANNPNRCAEENKVTFATGTLTDDALSWWNAYAHPIGIERANQIT